LLTQKSATLTLALLHANKTNLDLFVTDKWWVLNKYMYNRKLPDLICITVRFVSRTIHFINSDLFLIISSISHSWNYLINIIFYFFLNAYRVLTSLNLFLNFCDNSRYFRYH
jgi:hypothetical protein